jgi:hypothetical protein
MTWVLVIGGAWLLVAVATAVVIGRAVREADRRENIAHPASGTAGTGVPGPRTAVPAANATRAAGGHRPHSRARHGLRDR